jgi:hypothetical protein
LFAFLRSVSVRVQSKIAAKATPRLSLEQVGDALIIQLESPFEPCEFGFEVLFDAQIEYARQCLDQLRDALIIQLESRFEPCELGFEVLAVVS